MYKRSIATTLSVLICLMIVAVSIGLQSPTSVQAISRSEIINRARRWVDAQVPYNQSRWVTEENPQVALGNSNNGGGWRTDCSGLVSFAWNLRASSGIPDNRVTWTLAGVSSAINKGDLQSGDMLLNSSSHVLIFDQWVNAQQTEYWAYEMTPPKAVYRRVPYPYFAGYGTYLPYRYNNIQASQDTDGGSINYGDTKNGQINPAGDTDDFTFTGAANQVVLIEQNKNGSSLDSYVELYAPDGSKIGEDDDGGGNYNSRLQRTLSSSGTYRIRAKAYGSSTGAYSLRLTLVASQPAPADCGGDCEGDSRWISFGQTLNGTISPNSDTDTYYISLTSGRTASLRMNRNSGSLDSYMDLYAPNGAWVASNDDGGGDHNSWLVHAATQSGTYRIVARSYQAESSGQYQLVAESVSASNLAQGKPAYASSTEFSGVEPWKAVDGNGGTRWSSRFANDQWWLVDLGQDRDINQVVINWEAAYGRSFGIYVQPASQAGTNNWTSVWSTSDGRGGTTTANFSTRTARWVLFFGQTRATPYGFSFWEFGVYNTTTVLAPTVPGDDPSKLPDGEPQIEPLPPAADGKDPQLGSDQEYEPLVGASDPNVVLGANLNIEKPIAFIENVYTSASYDAQSTEPLLLTGNASARSGSNIVAYEWRSNLDGLLSTQITATVSVTQLAVGLHVISFRVQDSDGNWSDAITTTWAKAEPAVNRRFVFIPMTLR